MNTQPIIPLPHQGRSDRRVVTIKSRQVGLSTTAQMLRSLVLAEERLTRTARDEADLAALAEIRHTLAQIDPSGASKRWAKG